MLALMRPEGDTTMANDHVHPRFQRILDDLLRWGKVDDWIDAVDRLTPEQLAQLERNERGK
jgi:choline dehydrogenase-like flavoprotein